MSLEIECPFCGHVTSICCCVDFVDVDQLSTEIESEVNAAHGRRWTGWLEREPELSPGEELMRDHGMSEWAWKPGPFIGPERSAQ